MRSPAAKQDQRSSPSDSDGTKPTELENFTRALRQILSVRKADLDLHKPMRPRKPKRA